MTCSFATFLPQMAEEGPTFADGFCLLALAGGMHLSGSRCTGNARIFSEGCSGRLGEPRAHGASALPQHVHAHTPRMRGCSDTEMTCVHPGQVGWGEDGWLSGSLDTRSPWTNGTLGRAAPGQGLGQLMGPQGCLDCYFMGTHLSRSLETCMCV